MKLSDLGAQAGAVARAAVTASGRLHLGFLDPDGTLGRRFGSVGLAIDGPNTRLTLRFAEKDRVDAEPGASSEASRASEHLATLKRVFDRDRPVALHLHEILPPHAGFGSGTQLALAVARAFAVLHGLDVPTSDLARTLGRGRRSGIGVVAFDQGGLLLDGGVGRSGPAPLLARAEFPADWRVLLVGDPSREGLHGSEEARAIAHLAPMPQATAAHLSHLALMRILPAAHEQDFAAFAHGVSELQRAIGAFFAPAQGASAYSSAAVARLVEWLGAECGAGVGQSSWGPTGFAFFASHDDAQRAVERARSAGRIAPALALRLVKGRNHGAHVAR